MDLQDIMVGFASKGDVEKAQTDAESLAKRAATYSDNFELHLEVENPERLKTKKTYSTTAPSFLWNAPEFLIWWVEAYLHHTFVCGKC